MAPELFLGHHESTPKIDVWSLGVILHGLVLGELPFSYKNKDDIRKQILEREVVLNKKQISKDCKDLIEKMLVKDPNKRIGISDILEHPWIASYRQKKAGKECGIFGNQELSDGSADEE